MSSSRSELRTTYRAERRSLSDDARLSAEKNITKHLKQLPNVQTAKCIAAYCATDGEVDLSHWFCHTDTTVAIPRIGANKSMLFHRFETLQSLALNRFGILEPLTAAELICAANISVILLPLVSFDAAGNRLGRGGGYYDRYLGALSQRPYLVGIGFACQQHPALTRQAWDIPLNAVVTEDRSMEFN